MRNNNLHIDENFFKQFKSADELDNYLHQIFRTDVEKMLEAELDEHLGDESYSVIRE
jgi:transposase-like protein